MPGVELVLHDKEACFTEPDEFTQMALRRFRGPEDYLRNLQQLVTQVTTYGFQDLVSSLGHPQVLRALVEGIAAFMCPACDVRGFGVSRACAATAMYDSSIGRDAAVQLVQATLGQVLPGGGWHVLPRKCVGDDGERTNLESLYKTPALV